MTKKKNATPNYPRLRFPGFTDPWEQRKLGNEATEVIAGGDVDKTSILSKGKFPVIANALSNDGIIGYYENEFRVKAPAVTVTGRGDVGHAKAREADFTPVVRLLSIKTKHNVHFLENAINTLHIVIESTGVPQLTVPQLSRYELSFPKELEEELRIGAFFRTLDIVITLHQRKCDELKKLKKSFLQKMFPKQGELFPELRFPGFTDPWEQRKLGDLTNISSASRVHKNEWTESGVPFFRSSDVVSAFKGEENEKAFISYSLYEELAKKSGKVQEGDVLITGGGSIGIPYLVRNNEPLYFKDADLLWLRQSRSCQASPKLTP